MLKKPQEAYSIWFCNLAASSSRILQLSCRLKEVLWRLCLDICGEMIDELRKSFYMSAKATSLIRRSHFERPEAMPLWRWWHLNHLFQFGRHVSKTIDSVWCLHIWSWKGLGRSENRDSLSTRWSKALCLQCCISSLLDCGETLSKLNSECIQTVLQSPRI